MRQATWQEMWQGTEPQAPQQQKPAWWTKLALLSWEEWVTIIIVIIGFISVVQSIDNADWVAEMPSLYPIAFLGLAVGVALAKTRLNEAICHFLALVSGAAGVAVASTADLSGSLWSRVSQLVDRMDIWLGALTSGGISNDNLPFVVMVVALTYLTAYVSVWSIFRWYNAWIGLIPGGLALLTNISYLPGQNSFNLLVYLFCAIILVARIHVLRSARQWRTTSTRYPDLISLYVLNVTVWIAFALLAVAWVLPVGSGSGVLFSAWENVTSPIAGPFQDLGRLFASIDSKKGGTIHKFGSTLPLQGEITLGGGDVMEVVAQEPGFLRAQTYDFYTAQGWKVSGTNQITAGVWPALKALQSPEEARRQFRRPLSIAVTTLSKQGVMVSASQPLAVSVDSRVVFGPDPSDVTSIRPTTRLNEHTEYRVDSTITTASPARLRAAGTAYPAWTMPYLQLPDSLPARVKDKTRELTRAFDNPYDKANAIEQFLRTYAVDTKIPPAPANQDSVAYFLFEADRGYFDYFASAMVVMLRSQGVPARIAVGYTIRPQDRVPDTNTYVVSEGNAFAWPEAYFPGLGWVEFNPTPSEPRISRPGSDDLDFFPDDSSEFPDDSLLPDESLGPAIPADATLDQLAADEGSNLIGNIIMAVVLGLLALTAAGFGVFEFAWNRGLGGLDYAGQVWEKTVRLARWARIPLSPQQTPAEYAVKLEHEMPEVEDIGFLSTAYVRSRYGRKALTEGERARLATVWKAVRSNLLSRLFRWG